MNDIIPCLIKTEPKDETENLNDSGIVIDTKVDESAVAPQPSVSSTPAVQTVPEKKHQCQFCQKPYQSISGLKYHLKKASNETIIHIEAKFSFARPIGAIDSSLLQSAMRISIFKINFRLSLKL